MAKQKPKPFAFDSAPLRDTLKALSDGDLATFAASNAVDISAAGSREAVEATIVVAAEAEARAKYDLAVAAASKPAAAGPKLDKIQTATVRQVWDGFARNVPYAAQSSGHHELTEAEIEAAPDHGVPDGRYRVLGADWILIFAAGRFVEAEKATAAADTENYQHVD